MLIPAGSVYRRQTAMCVAASTKVSSVVLVDGQGQRSPPLRRQQSFHYEVSALLILSVEHLIFFKKILSFVPNPKAAKS